MIDEDETPMTFFEVVDLLFGVFPLFLWLIGFGFFTFIMLVMEFVGISFLCLGVWLFSYWVACGLWHTVMNRRRKGLLREKRRSIVVRLCMFVMLGVLGNVLGALSGFDELSIVLLVGVSGPVYVSIRHLFLIYLDMQKEKLHGS